MAALKTRNLCIPGYSREEILARVDVVDRANAGHVLSARSAGEVFLRGWSLPSLPPATATLGVNYEGHKITEHALRCGAVCTLNMQVAMDAPFLGEVADEATRATGPAEASFSGFDRGVMLEGISKGINACAGECRRLGATTLVVQVARGRSAQSFLETSIAPYLPADLDVKIYCGYQSVDFFPPPAAKVLFGFINIGMFARLTAGVLPGEVFACVDGLAVQATSGVGALRVVAGAWQDAKAGRGIAVGSHGSVLAAGLPLVRLLGIADDMPFVTPSDYSRDELLALFDVR